MNLKNASLLIIDDDGDVLTAVRLLLKSQVKSVEVSKDPSDIPALFAGRDYDIVMLDMNFNASVNTGNEGLFWLRKIKSLGSQAAIIMITAYADVDLAVRSLKEGATDFVVKPWQNDRLIETLKECLQKTDKAAKTEKPVTSTSPIRTLLGESEAMQEVFQKIEKIAPTDANILILGENGTGKDLVANAIHLQSLRAAAPYVKVDVGALTETLFESELFGHVKGAFTDAREDRAGRFEAASGGTLFLDEIGNISLQQQSKLLTVLQNRQIIKLGSNKPVDVDIRLLCATNLPVTELAKESRFRKDLVYRINTVEITLPPLRKRGSDIPLLAQHFTALYAAKYLKPAIELHKSALDKLLKYHFPGNVRELQYTIERAVIMCDGDLLRDTDLIFSPIETGIEENEDSDTRLTVIERNTILKVIEKNSGNISKAARELGLTRTALYRRLNKYDI
ncbi:MAG TPA: sigma-54 dependent transcriptional regulator [Phnomibacter sp.]|nr:sigma-54 dependent transcriptional regulator [Phnomibacter sp.]